MSIAQAVHGLTAPFLIGTALSTFLCGVTVAQCCTYFTTFRNDRPFFRLAVAILFFIDLTHTAFCQVTLWLWFVIHFGEPTKVIWSPWSFAVSPALCGVATLVVQLFYAYRVWSVGGRHRFIPSLIVFGALWQLAWSCGATWQIFVVRYFADFHVWTYGVACWLAGAAANDLLITTSLVWILMRSKTEYNHSNNMFDRLIALTIETNGLTFAIALFDLILFAASDNAYHIIPNLCIIKLYINSFLVSLNSRNKPGDLSNTTSRQSESKRDHNGQPLNLHLMRPDPITVPNTDNLNLKPKNYHYEVTVTSDQYGNGNIGVEKSNAWVESASVNSPK